MTRLTAWLPEDEAKQVPAMLNLANVAPIFRHVKSSQDGAGYLAEFPDLAEFLHVVVMFMEEAVKMPGIRITVNDRPVARPIQFWSALLCYWESLAEPDRADYCLSRSARVGDVSGCPNRACLTHCQFICARCLDIVREGDAPPVGVQLLEIARRAEVDWCPKLRLPA